MNKELLANLRNILIPTLASRLKKTNYEGQGEKDAIEFTHDMTEIFDLAEQQLSAQPGTAKRIVGKSRDGMTLWYQCDMCNEPVDAQDNYCRGCGRRLTDG